MQKLARLTKKHLVIIIFSLALILRVWKITEFPAGLNADEAAIGYNAYSLVLTGKDEFGHSWPISFQSFNDFKPGLYFYLVLPFVKVLGLNELAIRLPSVILGSMTVAVLYFLVIELFKSDFLASICSFFLAISPWHLQFSRGGWETNAATFFIVLGVYFFFKTIRNSKYIAFSFFSFILSLYTYHSARIISPLLLLGLIILNFGKIFKKDNRRWLAVSFLMGFILVIPLATSMIKGGGVSRFSGVGIFADEGPYWRTNELRGQHQDPYSRSVKLIHNKYLEYGLRFFDNYFRHFSGDFLFISGDEIQRNRVPEMGQMYLVEIPFLLLGFYFLIRNRPKNWLFLLWWLIVAPLASALTFQSPHAIRALNMIIPLVIISGYGLMNLLTLGQEILKKKLMFLAGCLLFTIYFWNFSFYLHQYYIHYHQIYPAAWEYGFKELAGYLQDNEQKYQKIYITDRYDQPYIILAFYFKYPPSIFQKEAKLTPKDQYGFSTVANFDKYHFGRIEISKIKRGGVLVIGSPEEVPESVGIIKRVYFKDGIAEAFRITEL